MAKTVSMQALKAFVRHEGIRFLGQENVTSVGVGYKVKAGKPTADLCIQFTVGRKVEPEGLEAIGAVAIPPSFVIDGLEVPTDVIERSFARRAREVTLGARLEAASVRKAVVDPVAPGVSIGHPRISAGTAGCVVYDAQSGAPYILSNWHVLNGPEGAIGDAIVQPGRHDDNRVERNVVGRLVRSHLGVAGDCAVASVDRRRLEARIIGLDVAIDRIGEPDLGDRVVKSGRTTEVTWGIVNRVHTIARIDYEAAGTRQIGCFEVGPDPDHPAPDGEISMGGDSGSAWLLVEGRRPTGMMLGLHFAGEVGDEPEHALACYAASVFEKLQILPGRATGAARPEAVGLGYAPAFVGAEVPLPSPDDGEVGEDLLEAGGSPVIEHTHFSLAMSRSRRFARWVAWNIDGGSLRRLSRTGMRFRKDPAVPGDAQVGNELYSDNALDRGHIARRADLVWGGLAEAERANADSFYYTNITPQHEAFNQSDAGGIWGALEDAIFADVDVADLRVSVIAGPILAPADPVYRGVRLPRQFWKVIYYREAGSSALRAHGYVLTQADLLNRLEVLDLPEFSVYEGPIPRITEMTGLVLASGEVGAASRRPETAAQGAVRRIGSVREIVRS
jgi:endonuclease G, mitochondrial